MLCQNSCMETFTWNMVILYLDGHEVLVEKQRIAEFAIQ